MIDLQTDPVAERQLLAIVLGGNRRHGQQFLALPAEAITDGSLRPVAEVLRHHIARGNPVDAYVVEADVAASFGSDTDRAERARHLVRQMDEHAPPGDGWGFYYERVTKLLALRATLSASLRLQQRLETTTDLDEIGSLVTRGIEDLQASTKNLVSAAVEPPMSLQALLDREDEPHDWLVPGLLERMDRLMLTGFEGTGKSYLLAQMALCIAAGLHPFTGALIREEGFRVLVLDCENSEPQIRRRYRKTAAVVNRLREQLGLRPADWSQQVRLNVRPDGIDLGNGPEHARIEQAIAATAPDLVLGGPLYKMHRANIAEEGPARDLVGVLDDWRGRYKFSLILEAHVGHVGETNGGRKLRPTGSSLFLRWPEFGYGIRAFDQSANEEHPSTVQMVAWRGSRDERDWPGLLSHSAHELPWTPSEPTYRERHGLGPFRSMRVA